MIDLTEKRKRERSLQAAGSTQKSTDVVAKNAGKQKFLQYLNCKFVSNAVSLFQERLRRTKTLEETCKRQEKVKC